MTMNGNSQVSHNIINNSNLRTGTSSPLGGGGGISWASWARPATADGRMPHTGIAPGVRSTFTLGPDALIYDNHVLFDRASQQSGPIHDPQFLSALDVGGGGLRVMSSYAEINIYGTIRGNSAMRGGGIHVHNPSHTSGGGSFEFHDSMNINIYPGAQITYNHARSQGGGIWINQSGPRYAGLGNFFEPGPYWTSVLTMHGGTIAYNWAPQWGGGVSVRQSLWGAVSGVPSPAQRRSGGTFIMHGGEIRDNGFEKVDIIENEVVVGYERVPRTQFGGGVHVEAFAHNATVRNDWGTATFTLTGNSPTYIIGNMAILDGGGIHSQLFQYSAVLSDTNIAYRGLTVNERVVFANNWAGRGSAIPPENWYITNIDMPLSGPSAGVMGLDFDPPHRHTLNNYDINFLWTQGIRKWIQEEEDVACLNREEEEAICEDCGEILGRVCKNEAEVGDTITYVIRANVGHGFNAGSSGQTPAVFGFSITDQLNLNLVQFVPGSVRLVPTTTGANSIGSEPTYVFNDETGLLTINFEDVNIATAVRYVAFDVIIRSAAAGGEIPNTATLHKANRPSMESNEVITIVDGTPPLFTITFHPYAMPFYTTLFDMFTPISTGVVNGRPVVTVAVTPGQPMNTWAGEALLNTVLNNVGNIYGVPFAAGHSFWGWFSDETLTASGRTRTRELVDETILTLRRPALNNRCFIEEQAPGQGVLELIEAGDPAVIEALFGSTTGGNLDLFGVWARWGDVNDDDDVCMDDLHLLTMYLFFGDEIDIHLNLRAANVLVNFLLNGRPNVDMDDLDLLTLYLFFGDEDPEIVLGRAPLAP